MLLLCYITFEILCRFFSSQSAVITVNNTSTWIAVQHYNICFRLRLLCSLSSASRSSSISRTGWDSKTSSVETGVGTGLSSVWTCVSKRMISKRTSVVVTRNAWICALSYFCCRAAAPSHNVKEDLASGLGFGQKYMYINGTCMTHFHLKAKNPPETLTLFWI